MQRFRTLNFVKLLEALATAFINTFGITQPSDAMRRRAAWFIFVLLIVMLFAVFAVGTALYLAMRR